jgi:hypothetical protein
MQIVNVVERNAVWGIEPADNDRRRNSVMQPEYIQDSKREYCVGG